MNLDDIAKIENIEEFKYHINKITSHIDLNQIHWATRYDDKEKEKRIIIERRIIFLYERRIEGAKKTLQNYKDSLKYHIKNLNELEEEQIDTEEEEDDVLDLKILLSDDEDDNE